jgi:hypothetical protein
MRGLALILGPVLALGCDVYDATLVLDASTPETAVEACATMCNGACVDTQTDKNNCGTCAETCEVSCTAGLCTPTPLATSLGAPHGIVINGSSLYVAEFGGINIFSLSKIDGTGLKNFATGQIFPDRLATDGTTLWWTDNANITSDPGGALEEEFLSQAYCNAQSLSTYCWLANKLPAPYGIAVQGTTLFFTTTAQTNVGCPGLWASAVLSCSTGGCAAIPDCATSGGPTVLASNQTQLAGIAADAKNIYWADSGAHVIRFCGQPTCSGGPQTFADNLGTPYDVVSNGTTVFFTDRTAGNLYACPTTGCGSSPTVLATGLVDPLLLAVDTKSVYATLYMGGSIVSCSLPSCAGGATTLAKNLKGPYGIVSDGTYIYWTEEGSSGANSTDGSISKLKLN